MISNMGKSDRIFRSVIGIVIISIGAYLQSWWGALGLISLATAVFAWCPFNYLFGVSTNKTD